MNEQSKGRIIPEHGYEIVDGDDYGCTWAVLRFNRLEAKCSSHRDAVAVIEARIQNGAQALTAETLDEIRARDSEWVVGTDAEFVEALHIHPVPCKELVWPREWGVHDRRLLLSHIEATSAERDRLRLECEQLREYGMKRDGELSALQAEAARLREALSEIGDVTVQRLRPEQKLAGIAEIAESAPAPSAAKGECCNHLSPEQPCKTCPTAKGEQQKPCICADPENCTVVPPGYEMRCKRRNPCSATPERKQ